MRTEETTLDRNKVDTGDSKESKQSLAAAAAAGRRLRRQRARTAACERWPTLTSSAMATEESREESAEESARDADDSNFWCEIQTQMQQIFRNRGHGNCRIDLQDADAAYFAESSYRARIENKRMRKPDGSGFH